MFCLRVANTLITTVYCPKSVPMTSQSGRNTDLDEKPPGLLPAYQEALPLAAALLSFTVTVGHSCL